MSENSLFKNDTVLGVGFLPGCKWRKFSLDPNGDGIKKASAVAHNGTCGYGILVDFESQVENG